MFRKRRKASHPARHALVQIFLEHEADQRGAVAPAFGYGPWKCPNRYADHFGSVVLAKATVKRKEGVGLVASARCSCGFRFTFHRTECEDPQMPVINRTRGLGPAWVSEARRLQADGACVNSIAASMGIDNRTVTRLLEDRPIKAHVPDAVICEWRVQWERLLKSVPNRSRQAARQLDDSLYRRLRRNDREWLYAESRRGTAEPVGGRQVDWASRDVEWASRLEAAAQRIKSELPLRRASACGIIQNAGLDLATMAKRSKLPRCDAALLELAETVDDFRVRRLDAAFRRLDEFGMPRKEWALRRLTGLEGKVLSDRVSRVMSDLLVPT